MTQGSRVSDNQVWSSHGSYKIGNKWTKTWTGTDRPKNFTASQGKAEHVYNMSIFDQQLSEINYILYQNGKYYPQFDYWYQWNQFSGWPDVNALVASVWNSNDVLKLWGKLGNKTRKSEFNGSNFLAEIRQPVQMIDNIAKRLAAAMYHVRLGSRKAALGALQVDINKPWGKYYIDDRGFRQRVREDLLPYSAMSEMILTVQYGIRPLLADAYDAASALSNIVNNFQPPKRVKVRRTKSASDSQTINGNIFHIEAKKFVEFRATIKEPLTWRQQLNLDNPLSAMWEVTPWSFVFDWFLPIGDYIDAFGVAHMGIWDGVWTSEKVEKKSSLIGVTWPQGVKAYPAVFPYAREISLIRKQVASRDMMLPDPPSFTKGIVPEHWLNGFALIGGAKTAIGKTLKF